ncbi:MCP four helix bundle domain-containing protein [Fibrella aquatica]|uniref:MCP four helix bundle domain-containing protein n=1 Tax=Fibrella aquatica TaxID=3242487 RepID=UPI003522744E
MKQLPENRSRLQLTLLVVSLLGLILTSIFLNRRSIHQVQETSVSIYKDRLIPTAIITRLTAKIYQKRLLLEPYMLGKTNPDAKLIETTLSGVNDQIDSLLTEFEHTRLTSHEADQLTLLKQRLATYNQLEKELTTNLANLPKAQQVLFAGNGYTTFNQVAQTLTELSAVQLTVGEELLNESRGQTKYIYVLTALQIALVFIVGFSLFWHRF